MIGLDRESTKFTYRVAGVALRDGEVLLHRADHDDFWGLPGGRCEMLEPSAETLAREMREEIEADVTVERLLWVVENFFEYNGVSSHELGLYYLMSLPPDSAPCLAREPFDVYEGTLKLIFQWHPIETLTNVIIKPSFLNEAIRSLTDGITHVVHHDR